MMVRTFTLAAALAALALAAAAPAPAWAEEESDMDVLRQEIQEIKDYQALREEIDALKAGQREMRDDLADIKKLIQEGGGDRGRGAVQARAQPGFEPKDISVADAPFLGEGDAPVTLVEFTDYQCPFCRRHQNAVKPEILKDYVEAGKVKYVLRQFPIPSLHPQAIQASEGALCAGDQGKYWEMHEKIFANQKKVSPDDLAGYAEEIGLDRAAFVDCLNADKFDIQIQADMADGRSAGVRGTPSFFLGLTDSGEDGKIKATKYIRGAQSYAKFKQDIEELLEEAGKGA